MNQQNQKETKGIDPCPSKTMFTKCQFSVVRVYGLNRDMNLFKFRQIYMTDSYSFLPTYPRK